MDETMSHVSLSVEKEKMKYIFRQNKALTHYFVFLRNPTICLVLLRRKQ